MEREDYQIAKKKIIKTNDLLDMYQVKIDKLNKASQAFKQLKTKYQSACQEAERLKLDNEQLKNSINKYKTDLEQTSNNFAQLQCEYRSLEAKYEQIMIDSQMTITELEEKVKQHLSNKNMAPSSPGKKNADDRLRELKRSYSELKEAEHRKAVENKSLLKEINQLKNAAAKEAEKIIIKDCKEINDLKDQLQKANATIQEQNRLNSIEKSHKEDSETEVATLKSEISVLEGKCRCLTELLNSAKNTHIDRCDIFTQTEYSLPQDAKTVSSPPQVRHCIIDSDEFASLMEVIRLPLLSPIRSDSSDSPNSLSMKKPRKLRNNKKKLQGKFDAEAPPPAPTEESVEHGENQQNNTLENQDTTINFTNTLKRIPDTKEFALCVEEEERLYYKVEHNTVSESISTKNDQFVHANVNNSSEVNDGVRDIWSMDDLPPNNAIPIKYVTTPSKTQQNLDSLNMETSSASGFETIAPFLCKHPSNESLNIPLVKRDEKDPPECTPMDSRKRVDDSFTENSSTLLPEAQSTIQQSKQHNKSKTKMKLKANERRKILMPYNTTRLLPARAPTLRQCKKSEGDTILSALQLLKANNISFTISSDSLQPFPSLMICPPKAEIPSDFQSDNKPFQCRTVCLDENCTQNGMLLQEARQGEEPELLGFFRIKDEATTSPAAGGTTSQLPDVVKQLAEQLVHALKEMNGSKKKQVRKCCKPRRNTSSDDNSKSEFERICDAPGVLQRNKRLLAKARRQSNRLNNGTRRESDSNEFLDSGLVTATTKHDTDSQSLFSYNEDEVFKRNFRSSSANSDVTPVRKNVHISYSKALAARSSTKLPTYQKIDQDNLTEISKSNSDLFPNLFINTLDLECSPVEFKSEVRNSFELDELSEPEDLFAGNTPNIFAKTTMESKVDTISVNALDSEVSSVELKTAEVNNGFSGLGTSVDELNLADSFIEKDSLKMNKKRKKQSILAETSMESKVDNPETSIISLNRNDSYVELKIAEIKRSLESLDTPLDEPNKADSFIEQNKKQELIGKTNAECKVGSPKPSINTLRLECLPVESKRGEVNNGSSGLDTSFDEPKEAESFIEKDTVKRNQKRKKQNIIAKTSMESKVDSSKQSINTLNRTDPSIDLKINGSLDTSLDEPNEADNLIGRNKRKKQNVIEKISTECKVDSAEPSINTFHLEGLPVESKTTDIKDGFSDLDTSLGEPNETESLTENKKTSAIVEPRFASPRTRRSQVKIPALETPSTRLIQLRNKSIQVEPKIEKPKKVNQQKYKRNSPICSNESEVDCDHVQQMTCSGKVASTDSKKLNESSSTIKKNSKNVRNTRAKSKRITRSSPKIISKEYVSGSSSDCSVKDETDRAYFSGNGLNTELNQEKKIVKSPIRSSSKRKLNIGVAVNRKYDTNQLFGSESDSSDQDLADFKPKSLLKEDVPEIGRVELTDESKQEVSCQITIPSADNSILNKFNRTVDENLKPKIWSENAQIQRDEIADQDELQRSLKRNFDEFKTRYNDKYLKPKPLKDDVDISLDEKIKPGFVWNIVDGQSEQKESRSAVSESTLHLDKSTWSCTQEELREMRENTKGNKIHIIQNIVVPARETSYCAEKSGQSDVTVQQNGMIPGGLPGITKSALPLAATSYCEENDSRSTSDLIDYSDMISDDCPAALNLESEEFAPISSENGDFIPNSMESLDSGQNPPSGKNKVMNRSEILNTMNRLIMFSEDVEVLNETAQKFCDQTVDFIAYVFLEKLCVDIFDKPNNDCPPSPVMTATQRIVLGFLTKLDNTTHKGILNKFLDVADLQLFKKPHDVNIIEPITRVYTAICRMQLNINRMRRFICESFYFADEYANSIFFIVLTMWGNVMPMAADVAKYPLAKIIIQLCYTKKKPVPQIMPLRDLLQKYFGYPADPWNSDELFEELLESYIKNPFERQSDFAILLFFKSQPAKIPNSNSNLRANLIIFMGNICSAFKAHIDEEWLLILEMNQWFETIQNVERDAVVLKSIILAKNRLPVRRPVKRRKGIKSVKVGETANETRIGAT
ncbi:hypothetical protein HUJ04_003534 [Dendroctonus ponderosae]|nr:hypothetical protein HUJ04_003534 [Dendroctonus ponderosae]